MLRRVEALLWIVALGAIGIYGGTVVERWCSQAYWNWKFANTLDLPARPVPSESFIRYSDQPLGRLEIPSIELSAIFIEGVDPRTLRRAIGHIPGTALPGMDGNVGLSGHRDTFFRRLGKLHAGDAIWIDTFDGRYEYVVESTRVVDPDEQIALRSIGRPTLTLITCYPFYYVGAAPKRFVVHAALVKGSL
jgi:sortase A